MEGGPTFAGMGRPGSRRRSSFWWLGGQAAQGMAQLELPSSINLEQMFEENGDVAELGVAMPPLETQNSIGTITGSVGGRRKSSFFSTVYPFPAVVSGGHWDSEVDQSGRKNSIASLYGGGPLMSSVGMNDTPQVVKSQRRSSAVASPRAHSSAAKEQQPSEISPKNIDGSARRKKQKAPPKTQTVVSNITSNRAKRAQIIHCETTPEKEQRIKGAVYQIGDERKKWDGRQWRRLCIVVDCCSAARGSADFCIVHGRGELDVAFVEGKPVSILKGDSPRGRSSKQKVTKPSSADATLTSVKKESVPVLSRSLSYSQPNNQAIFRKRKSSENISNMGGQLHKIHKTLDHTSVSQQQQPFAPMHVAQPPARPLW